jgi:hypothetical protein
MNAFSEGIIHGNIIELQKSLDFQDGKKVFVSVSDVPGPQEPVGADRYPHGTRALPWTEQDDQILAELYRQRQADTGREIP